MYKKGSCIDWQDLLLTLCCDRFAVFIKLRSMGSNVQKRTDIWNIALGSVAHRILVVLLNDDFGIDSRDGLDGDTPLLWAARHINQRVFKSFDASILLARQMATISLLLDRGANIDAVSTRDNLTAVQLASRNKNMTLMGLLKERGTKIDLQSMWMTCQRPSVDRVKSSRS
jgi:hypothetical protein